MAVLCDNSIFKNAFLLNTFDSMHQKAVSTNITLQIILQGKKSGQELQFQDYITVLKSGPFLQALDIKLKIT